MRQHRGSGQAVQSPEVGVRRPDTVRRTTRLTQSFAARFSLIEWVLMAILVLLPIALTWRFASSSYFFEDDIAQFYLAHTSDVGLSYTFAPMWGHLVPGYSLTYLALDRFTPMNFEVALVILVACQVVSAVLLQRILTLLFERAWWTYALALSWAISAVYLPSFAWFAAGLHSIPAITATLASIHGYLCWRATGRRAWLAWSLIGMVIGLAFYEKAWLIPLYLVLMRVLLLDPAVPLRDSLRSVRDEWRVWLAYVSVCAAFVLVYLLGSYYRPETGAPVGDVLRYLRVFWIEGFSPMVFGVRVPLPEHGQEDWHQTAIVVAQVTLVGLVAWSVARRRAAWRAWTFLLVAVGANALMVVGRVSQLGAEYAGYYIRYYTEPALLVALAIAFAFAEPRLRARVAPIEPTAPPAAPKWWSRRPRPTARIASFRIPGTFGGSAALVALAAYTGVTWATADTFSNRAGGGWDPVIVEKQSGRLAQVYFDNLRADLTAAHRAGLQPSLLNHDVPEAVMSPLTNLDGRSGVRNTLLSSVVPIFDQHATFNQPGRLHIVRSDGHLQRTKFVPAAGGSIAQLRRAGRLRIRNARVEHRRREKCIVAGGRRAAAEWEPRPRLRGRDSWLRATYQTDPVRPLSLQNNAGFWWADVDSKLPAMGSMGTAIVGLGELPNGAPSNGVRLLLSASGRLCLRSLEIGGFDPPPPSWKAVQPLRVAASNSSGSAREANQTPGRPASY